MALLDISFVFIFLIGILIITFVGHSLFSCISVHKTFRLSFLENFAISIGAGYTFIVIYGYCLDFIASLFNPNSIRQSDQLLFFVIIPFIIGMLFELTSMKINIGKSNSLTQHLKSNFHRIIDNLKLNVVNFREKVHSGKIWSRFILYTIIIIVVFSFFLNIIYTPFTQSPAQFSYDPYFWIDEIYYYFSTFTFNYGDIRAYPAGFLVFTAVLLSIMPNAPFSIQFAFLKWFPLFNLFLFLFLLYIICHRISRNPLFFIAAFLITLNLEFYYRFIVLLPSILTIPLMEIFVLESLIAEIPAFLRYLTLGTIFMFHALNGVIFTGFFLSYIIIEGLIGVYQYAIQWRKKIPQTRFFVKIREIGKKILQNTIAFIFPIVIVIISFSIRLSPTWYNNYLWFLQGMPQSTNAISKAPLVGGLGSIIQPLSSTILVDWSVFSDSVAYILKWGNYLYPITLLCIIFPQKYYVNSESKEKQRIVLFLRVSLLLTFVLFMLSSFSGLLLSLNQIPGVSIINTAIASGFFDFTRERLFEVSDLLNALLIALFFMGMIQRFTSHPKISRHLPNPEMWQILSMFIVVCIVGGYSVNSFHPYYEYPYDSRYIDAALWLRDYLDANDPHPSGLIECMHEDQQIGYVLRCIITPWYSVNQLTSDLTPDIMNSFYPHNSTNYTEYLLITFPMLDKVTADYIVDSLPASHYQIYFDNFILILKF